jgi:TIR domain
MIFQRGHFKANKIVNLNESIIETRTFSKSKTEYKPTVFISHKHSDLEDQKEVKGILEIFENLGAKVYIDSMDNKMPEETSGETALRIKEVIKYTKKFVLVATEKAIESYWCNWELGIGDTHKYIDNIAIIPIKEKGEYDHQYKGNEYLQIYPKIDFYKSFTNWQGHFFKEGYYVVSPKDKNGKLYLTELQVWLKQ